MRKRATLLVLAALLAGCGEMITLPGLTPQSAANQPVEPLAGVSFRPITSENARLLSGNAAGAATPTAGAATAPRAADSAARAVGPAPEKGVVSSGTVNSYYGYGHYFGGYGGGGDAPMALVSVTEAETAGAAGGSFQEVLAKVVNPVVKAWAKDARLVQSSGSSDMAETTAVGPAPGGATGHRPLPVLRSGFEVLAADKLGWTLQYLSPQRKEALTFTITPAKTVILRMRWAPLDLAPETVKVDSNTAADKLVAAIENANFKSEEEKSGSDYFVGTSFAPQPDIAPGGRIEPIYDVPGNARWNVSLQSIMGKPVWELSYYAPSEAASVGMPGVAVGAPDMPVSSEPMPASSDSEAPESDIPPSDPGFYFNNHARGLVDARTGAVIRFSRPFRHYYQRPETYPAKPLPSPTATTTPSPTPAP